MAASSKLQLEQSWAQAVGVEFEQPYMAELRQFLRDEKAAGKIIFPPGKAIFAAFNTTPLPRVKVVILGQDPYHGPGQAHGLAFSVLPGVQPPPSLRNIFKEIQQDVGAPIPEHGCLQAWAEQGVLLLNATLTVESSKAGSHQRRGWERFTDQVIQVLSREREGLVFMLWGSYAQQKAQLIDGRRHQILKAPHPSPLSAHRGFFGSRHFSKANAWLKAQGQAPVDWSLPPRDQALHK